MKKKLIQIKPLRRFNKKFKKGEMYMGIKDILNATKIKEENERLKELMTPELQEASDLLAKINDLNKQLEAKKQQLNDLDSQVSSKKTTIN